MADNYPPLTVNCSVMNLLMAQNFKAEFTSLSFDERVNSNYVHDHGYD